MDCLSSADAEGTTASANLGAVVGITPDVCEVHESEQVAKWEYCGSKRGMSNPCTLMQETRIDNSA
jgi:hypothetical protein